MNDAMTMYVEDNLNSLIKQVNKETLKHKTRFASHLVEDTLFDVADAYDSLYPAREVFRPNSKADNLLTGTVCDILDCVEDEIAANIYEVMYLSY